MKHLIVCILVATMLGGCVNDTAGPTGKFRDAEFRFVGSVTEPFEETHDLELPAGAHTVRLSVVAESGFGIDFVAPDGTRNGFTHSNHVDLHSLAYTTATGSAGAWKLQFGCDGPCTYAVAVDQGNIVRSWEVPLEKGDLKAHVSGKLSGESLHDRRVDHMDVNFDDVTVVFNAHGTERMHWSVHDGNGDLVSFWRFTDVTANNWRYDPSPEVTAQGAWRVGVECDAPCSFNFGVV